MNNGLSVVGFDIKSKNDNNVIGPVLNEKRVEFMTTYYKYSHNADIIKEAKFDLRLLLDKFYAIEIPQTLASILELQLRKAAIDYAAPVGDSKEYDNVIDNFKNGISSLTTDEGLLNAISACYDVIDDCDMFKTSAKDNIDDFLNKVNPEHFVFNSNRNVFGGFVKNDTHALSNLDYSDQIRSKTYSYISSDNKGTEIELSYPYSLYAENANDIFKTMFKESGDVVKLTEQHQTRNNKQQYSNFSFGDKELNSAILVFNLVILLLNDRNEQSHNAVDLLQKTFKIILQKLEENGILSYATNVANVVCMNSRLDRNFIDYVTDNDYFSVENICQHYYMSIFAYMLIVFDSMLYSYWLAIKYKNLVDFNTNTLKFLASKCIIIDENVFNDKNLDRCFWTLRGFKRNDILNRIKKDIETIRYSQVTSLPKRSALDDNKIFEIDLNAKIIYQLACSNYFCNPRLCQLDLVRDIALMVDKSFLILNPYSNKYEVELSFYDGENNYTQTYSVPVDNNTYAILIKDNTSKVLDRLSENCSTFIASTNYNSQIKNVVEQVSSEIFDFISSDVDVKYHLTLNENNCNSLSGCSTDMFQHAKILLSSEHVISDLVDCMSSYLKDSIQHNVIDLASQHFMITEQISADINQKILSVCNANAVENKNRIDDITGKLRKYFEDPKICSFKENCNLDAVKAAPEKYFILNSKNNKTFPTEAQTEIRKNMEKYNNFYDIKDFANHKDEYQPFDEEFQYALESQDFDLTFNIPNSSTVVLYIGGYEHSEDGDQYNKERFRKMVTNQLAYNKITDYDSLYIDHGDFPKVCQALYLAARYKNVILGLDLHGLVPRSICEKNAVVPSVYANYGESFITDTVLRNIFKNTPNVVYICSSCFGAGMYNDGFVPLSKEENNSNFIIFCNDMEYSTSHEYGHIMSSRVSAPQEDLLSLIVGEGTDLSYKEIFNKITMLYSKIKNIAKTMTLQLLAEMTDIYNAYPDIIKQNSLLHYGVYYHDKSANAINDNFKQSSYYEKSDVYTMDSSKRKEFIDFADDLIGIVVANGNLINLMITVNTIYIDSSKHLDKIRNTLDDYIFNDNYFNKDALNDEQKYRIRQSILTYLTEFVIRSCEQFEKIIFNNPTSGSLIYCSIWNKSEYVTMIYQLMRNVLDDTPIWMQVSGDGKLQNQKFLDFI